MATEVLIQLFCITSFTKIKTFCCEVVPMATEVLMVIIGLSICSSVWLCCIGSRLPESCS